MISKLHRSFEEIEDESIIRKIDAQLYTTDYTHRVSKFADFEDMMNMERSHIILGDLAAAADLCSHVLCLALKKGTTQIMNDWVAGRNMCICGF